MSLIFSFIIAITSGSNIEVESKYLTLNIEEPSSGYGFNKNYALRTETSLWWLWAIVSILF